MRGLSEVMGMISDTVLRKMVRERRIVTPEMRLLSLIVCFDDTNDGN